MRERVRLKQREPEAKQPSSYEKIFTYMRLRREQGLTGGLVRRAAEIPWEQNRQGHLRYYLYPGTPDVGLADWMVFTHDIQTKSGKHRHQGGLVIYVLKGKGFTTVDDDRVDWEKGDLLLLPCQPGGVTHQHFNTQVDQPSTWLALLFTPWFGAMGDELEQVEVSPNFKGYDSDGVPLER